ncbi:hypothetical protein SAMN02745206_02036 [Desulfacinum infernum DSM 9756]|uniref:Uncharacterized protein n=1 Tax=Desulfacinum infernum DSM 9756 TaxID=1121391 RepID=A0A1M5BVA5_9BACT|nr:hypothetical protein [Desulfacinum infernum]SHF46494.1 hypothetical protein SAMN02745206_02036 [Desulfacinum infernum DSM 9756]
MATPLFTTSVWNSPWPGDAPPREAILPSGLSEDIPSIRYADYFAALEAALGSHDLKPLRSALASVCGETIPAEAVEHVHLESVKHGAFYHVARMEVTVGGRRISLVMNVAVSDRGRAALEREWRALGRVVESPGGPFFPRCHHKGEFHCEDVEGKMHPASYFLAEWFEGYHEFHLQPLRQGGQGLHVWDGSPRGRLLVGSEAAAVYREGARILTLCLDRATFEQIFPWHHAAGDMVVRCGNGEPSVRMISARDYRTLVPAGRAPHERTAAAMAFFYGLAVRLRVDREQGTGRLVWADAGWVRSMVEGFWSGWREAKPRAGEAETDALRRALLGFSAEDWTAFGQYLLDDLIVDPEESSFIASRLEDHAKELAVALGESLE